MIFDRFENRGLYKNLGSNFQRAFSWMEQFSPEISVGTHTISGREVFAIVAEDSPRLTSPVLECHRDYADIQFSISGNFRVGVTITGGKAKGGRGYNSERDLEFLDGSPESFLLVHPGDILILFPNDLHAPMPPESGALKKVVIKVKL